jgi:hypothetical protein
MEQNGNKAEAIANFQGFLSQFEKSTARLLQVAEARVAMECLK